MRQKLSLVPGVLLCCLLAIAGNALVAWARLPLPGAVVGIIVYGLMLFGGRGIGWSRAGAALLLRWLGAMIVPALVGLGLHGGALAGAVLPVLALLVTTTLATALATALLYRLAGGRG